MAELFSVGLCSDVATHPFNHASYPVPVSRPPVRDKLSVQTFAVWLTSVLGSPQTTLPLANASDKTPRIRDFRPLDSLLNIAVPQSLSIFTIQGAHN